MQRSFKKEAKELPLITGQKARFSPEPDTNKMYMSLHNSHSLPGCSFSKGEIWIRRLISMGISSSDMDE